MTRLDTLKKMVGGNYFKLRNAKKEMEEMGKLIGKGSKEVTNSHKELVKANRKKLYSILSKKKSSQPYAHSEEWLRDISDANLAKSYIDTSTRMTPKFRNLMNRKHLFPIAKKYKDMGGSKELKSQKHRLMASTGIAGGVAVGGVGGHAAYKHHKNNKS